MTRLLVVPFVLTLLTATATALPGPTPVAPPGYAVVLEPSDTGDQWVLVPLSGTLDSAPPSAPPGYAVVARPARSAHGWVLVPVPYATQPTSPEPPRAPEPRAAPTPPVPAAAPEPGSEPEPPPPAPLDLGADADIIELERQIVERINTARAEKGLPPLQPHPLLADAARSHSQEMASKGYFAHESPTKGSKRFVDRIRNAGITAIGSAAENIAMGTYRGDPADGVVKSWMESEGHRDNIIAKRYVYTGVGVAVNEQGVIYSTQVFTSELGQ